MPAVLVINNNQAFDLERYEFEEVPLECVKASNGFQPLLISATLPFGLTYGLAKLLICGTERGGVRILSWAWDVEGKPLDWQGHDFLGKYQSSSHAPHISIKAPVRGVVTWVPNSLDPDTVLGLLYDSNKIAEPHPTPCNFNEFIAKYWPIPRRLPV